MLSNYATALIAFLALAAPALAENKLAARANGALGDACRYNSQCREYPTGARPSCDSTGHCNFVCLNAPILMKNAAGTGCVPNGSLPQQCTYASDCSGKTRLPANAVNVCLYNQCTYQCGDGYHKIAGKCYRNQNTCGGTRCATVTNGDTFCGANNQCVYRCDQAEGYTLYANAAKTAYRCFNTGTDVNNCGAIGRSCGNPYGGVGLSVCVSGTCSVTCPAGDVIKTTSTGQYYCASQ